MPTESDVRRSTVLLLGFFVIGIELYFVGIAVDRFWLQFLGKPIPLVVLATWSALSYDSFRKDLAAIPICLTLGQISGLCGDVVLQINTTGLHSDTLFIAGLASFLSGHLFYAAAFSFGAKLWAPIYLLIVAAYALPVIPILAPNLGTFLPPVLIYMIAQGIMIWRAAAWGQAKGGPAYLATIGGLLFAFSDTLIAVDMFVIPISNAWVPIMITYWLAQLAIATSINFQGCPETSFLKLPSM